MNDIQRLQILSNSTSEGFDVAVMRSFSLEEMKQAFKAGQDTIWEDLEQTTRCAKFESFEEWFENYAQLQSLKLKS